MDDTKKIKLCIAITTILIIIILIILLILNLVKKQKESQVDTNTISGDLYNYDKNEIQTLTDKIRFYTVSKYVANYLDIINKNNTAYFGKDTNNNYVKLIDDNTIAKKILDILNKEYIEKNNITENNVFDFVEKVQDQEVFVPLKINILPGRVTEKYAVYGFVEDLEYKFLRECYFIVTLDVQNKTYDIEPILNKEYNDINEIKLTNNNINIEENTNNKYKNVYINNEYICNRYFESYKRMLIGDPDLAYKYLDEQYKNAKYTDINDFKNKINKEQIKKISLTKYSVSIKEGYTQYVCIDQDNNFYIFRENSVMDYTVILDTYTIDLPEFVKKYNASTDENKILINIQRCLDAINNQDYAYMYNKLDETFKKNHFKTLSDFEKYIKENFFAENKFAASNGQKQGEIYTYDITLTDSTKKETKKITKKFVMKLKEGTDFVMSFAV